MDKKEKIFVKLNIKDYTNRLEKILDKKKFSLDTKNLLLSMLYKIENGYADYLKTKVEVPNKNYYIENIFNIIQENCNDIVVAEFNSEASDILKEKDVKFILEKENGKIIAFANELLILNCILSINEENICMPQEKAILQIPISNVLNTGNHMNQVEVIRDFNGWSWDIIIKEVTDIKINLLFQTLLYLVGHKFIEEWIKNESELVDYIELIQSHLSKEYGEKRANEFVTLFCKLAIDITNRNNNEQREFWKQKKDDLSQEFNQLQDKKKYLEIKTKDKKNYTKQIEKIDKILSNKELLKEEYSSRNAKLPNKDKIFSISHLVNRLEKEREELLEKIKQCNDLIEPKGYVARKQEVEEKVNFLNKLDINKKQNTMKYILDLCNIFLECFQIKISKAQTKNEIMSYIYELRYYGFMALNEENKLLKDEQKIKQNFESAKKVLLEKAKKLNAIDEVTDNEEINEKIINKIFDSKMIDLNHMIIETRVAEGKLYADYYDEKVLETTVQIQSDKTVVLKKKTKLFI